MTGQPRVLRVNVAKLGQDGRVHLWRRGETPPPQVADTLGQHVWEGSEVVLDRRAARREALAAAIRQEFPAPQPDPAPPGADTPYIVGERGPELITVTPTPPADEPASPAAPAEAEPPRTGPGASADAWRDYARSLGQEVGAKAPRDAVIQQLADAGLIDP